MESVERSPESLTQLGMKQRYNELGDYTRAGQEKGVALAEAQLARMTRDFDRSKLSEGSRLSWDLFEKQVKLQREQLRWYWQQYAVGSTGGALDGVPVMMINAHSVDS
ncbi:MAG: DUF885 family protein, partial [Phenylobacterium sp.]